MVFVVPTNVLHRDHIYKESGVAYKMAKMQSHGDFTRVVRFIKALEFRAKPHGKRRIVDHILI